MIRRLLAVAAVALICSASRGATIVRLPEGHSILVSGRLVDGDDATFRAVAGDAPGTVVFLDGPGGDLRAGLAIGRELHARHFYTAVADGEVCASACGFAWLGGDVRYLGLQAAVGFHAASIVLSEGRRDSSAGDALIGAYLARIGYSDRAVEYLTGTSFRSITWLSTQASTDNGVDAEFLPPALQPSHADLDKLRQHRR